MASDEDREKHSKRRKKKHFAKLYDPSECKGAFSIKIEKQKYKREKISPKDLEVEGLDE